MNPEVIRAIRGPLGRAAQVIEETVHDCGREPPGRGTPSGIVYAALQAHGMRLNTYYQIIHTMERQGRIRGPSGREHDVLLPPHPHA